MSPAQLDALRAGPLAATLATSAEIVIGGRGEAARVAAVHRRAVTLLLEGGALVTLLPAGTALHPWAVTVPFEALLAALPRERLRIVLAAAEIVPLRLRRRPERLPAHVVELLLRSAAPAGAAPNVAPNAAPNVAPNAAPDVAPKVAPNAAPAPSQPLDSDPFDFELARALDRLQAGGEIGALAALVGLGPGLTPAADDVLVGLLAGLDLLRNASPAAARLRMDLVAALGLPRIEPEPGGEVELLRGDPLRSRTTSLSAQMLAAAAGGLYAEPLLGLMEQVDWQAQAVHDGSNTAAGKEIERAIASLTAMGHRSGLDTLRGFVATFGIALPRGFR